MKQMKIPKQNQKQSSKIKDQYYILMVIYMYVIYMHIIYIYIYIYHIYIVIHRQNSSVCLDRLDSQSWD